MAETILFNFASKVLGKLSSLALGEIGIGSGWDLEDELKTLEGTMSMIKALLVDAEQRQESCLVIRLWLERLQAALHEADNVLDEFQYEALRRQVLMNDRRIGVKVSKFFSCSSNRLVFQSKMGCRVKNIKKKLDIIVYDWTKFPSIEQRIESRTHDTSNASRFSSSVTDSEFVGRNEDRQVLLQLLTNSSVNDHETHDATSCTSVSSLLSVTDSECVNNDHENISVIAIVGIGGLGKTTLTKLLYNNKLVVAHFELRIWVRVAQDFDVNHVMQKIIKRITDSPCADFNSNQLQTVLQEKLNGRRFLLVLDDVCDCDNRDWVKFFKFLRDGANGSKIVVTTRNKLVASTVATVPVYNLGSLTDEDCHELLLKWAGRGRIGEHVNQLLEISMEIVKKCYRNPLAAKTLGNKLFMKTDESEWLCLKEKELWELVQKKNDILAVLRWSYDPLPANLKRCFIYCSIFPKNYELEIDKLIQLWMALGFIQSSSSLNHELEDIGTDYLNQLCYIIFLEKIEEQHGNILNRCRMPEIIHDLAVLMANEECLLSTANYGSGPISEKVKHVPFHDSNCSGKEVTNSLFKLNSLRTVFFPFYGVGAGDKGFIDRCISTFKYIHVLDLSNSCFRKLPHSIGNLKHLRFLDLSGNTNIERLPDVVCKLYNLQTLRIWNCLKVQELPKNIGNLINLRHLYLTTQQRFLPEKQIQRLTSLRSFRITRCENLTSLPEGMELLTALTTVTIIACPNLTSLPSTMKNLAKLRNLEISNCPNLNLSGWEDFRGLRRLQ